jgi:hypothetical protein
VRLHRSVGDEEHRRDLAVRTSFGDQLRDAALRGCELAASGRATSDPPGFLAGALRPQLGSERLEVGERLLQGLPRLAPAPRAPLDGPERQQRPRPLKRQ